MTKKFDYEKEIVLWKRTSMMRGRFDYEKEVVLWRRKFYGDGILSTQVLRGKETPYLKASNHIFSLYGMLTRTRRISSCLRSATTVTAHTPNHPLLLLASWTEEHHLCLPRCLQCSSSTEEHHLVCNYPQPCSVLHLASSNEERHLCFQRYNVINRRTSHY